MVTEASHKFRPDESTGQLIRRLWRDWLRPHRGRIAVGFLLMALVAGAAAAYPWLIKISVDRLAARDGMGVLWLTPLIVLFAVIKGGAAYGQTVVTTSVAFRTIAELQKAMFAHLMRADLETFQNTTSGKLVSRFTNDVNLLRDAVSKCMTGMVRDALTVIFMVIVMFTLDWLLALIVVALVPFAARPIYRIGRRLRRVSKKTQIELGELTSTVNEAFTGIRMIKADRLEDYQRQRASRTFENVYTLIMKMVKGRARTYPISESLGGFAVALVLAMGAWRIVTSGATLGDFTGFLAALGLAATPVRSFGALNAALQEGLAAAQRIFELLDTEPQIVDRPNAVDLKVASGNITLTDVEFSYGDGKPALHGISLDVPAGKTVALVGPSGAGKSTVFNLIPRFYEVDAGSVRIDDEDVRDVQIASLRAQVALVSQDITLFNDTVAANIAFGRPDATDADIRDAAHAAAAHKFIERLPDGYATIVGDRGTKLSGGERQRIAVARAILKNAPILLLDEATSALDAESELYVQDALRRLSVDRTTLVIAHRLSTVIDADLIYVLDGGRVVEQGNHTDLLTRGGLYARLCRLQLHKDAALGEAKPASATALRAKA